MMQQYTDKNLTCVDCGSTFLFSADDQEFYARKGFTNEPKRCKLCRDKRKSAAGEGRERTLYDVTCDGCGKQTQVPSIRPTASPFTAASATRPGGHRLTESRFHLTNEAPATPGLFFWGQGFTSRRARRYARMVLPLRRAKWQVET